MFFTATAVYPVRLPNYRVLTFQSVSLPMVLFSVYMDSLLKIYSLLSNKLLEKIEI